MAETNDNDSADEEVTFEAESEDSHEEETPARPVVPLGAWAAVKYNWFAILMGVLLVSLTSYNPENWIVFAPFIPVPFVIIAMRHGYRALPFAFGIATVVGIDLTLASLKWDTMPLGILAAVNAIIIPIAGTRILIACGNEKKFSKYPLLALSIFWIVVVMLIGVSLGIQNGVGAPGKFAAKQYNDYIVKRTCDPKYQFSLGNSKARRQETCNRSREQGAFFKKLQYRLAIPLGILVAVLAAGSTLLLVRLFAQRLMLPFSKPKPLSLFVAHWGTAYIAMLGFAIVVGAQEVKDAYFWLEGIGWGAIAVAVIAFGLQGAGLMSFSMHARKVRPGMRYAIWAVTAVTLEFSVFILAIFGAIESVLHLRQRILSRIERPD